MLSSVYSSNFTLSYVRGVCAWPAEWPSRNHASGLTWTSACWLHHFKSQNPMKMWKFSCSLPTRDLGVSCILHTVLLDQFIAWSNYPPIPISTIKISLPWYSSVILFIIHSKTCTLSHLSELVFHFTQHSRP